MNRINYKILTAVIITVGIAFTSCQTSKNELFSQKKYTHFHKDNGVAKTNPVIEKNSVLSQKLNKVEVNNFRDEVRCNSESIISSNEQLIPVAKATIKPVFKTNNTIFASSFSKQDKVKSNIRAAKKWLKSSGNTTAAPNDDVELLLLIILCLILPPLAVFLVRGMGTAFILSLILTLCFWLPGVIYALIVVLAGG